MNKLPEHRRVIEGRTWPTSWTPAHMDPIETYTRPWLKAVPVLSCFAACCFLFIILGG